MRKHYEVIQDGLKECGCACLLSIIRYYGGNIPMNTLLEMTNTTSNGTNFYDISVAANEIGLSAKGYKLTSISELIKIKTPFICQIIINHYKHFVVVYKINDHDLTIMDPAKGIIRINKLDFCNLWTNYILTLTPYKKLPFLEETNYLSKIVKETLKCNKLNILTVLGLTIITTIMTGMYSYYFKIIIDKYKQQNNFSILIITIIFITILTSKILLEYLRNVLIIKLNKKLDIRLITTTIQKIIYLPYSYYKNKTTGEIIARINDLFNLKNVIVKLLITVLLDLILAIFILMILFIINPTLTYLLLVITIIYFLTFLIYKPQQERIIDNIQMANAQTNSCLIETLLSYETVKGLNIEKIITEKALKHYETYIDHNLKLTKVINEKNLFNDLVTGIIISYLLYFGIKDVTNMHMTIGTLLTYYTLIFYFLNPIRNLYDFYQEYYYVKNNFKRVNNLLNYKYESLGNKSNVIIDGHIKISNLTFGYQKENPVLKKITLEINKGDKVLLMGTTGSGKSTLLKLLYCYYPVSKSKIYLDNIDLSNYTLATIRRNLTYISQNELLYTDTIKNNIILGREVSETAFEMVCKLTYVDEIAQSKPLSYDTPLEENGQNLSGGERQRIILARALLKPANIILIDEGLNQIDVTLERKILKQIFNYYQNKTIIIVSHRKHNNDLYNKLYQIKEGHLASINNYGLKGGKNGINQSRNVNH